MAALPPRRCCSMHKRGMQRRQTRVSWHAGYPSISRGRTCGFLRRGLALRFDPLSKSGEQPAEPVADLAGAEEEGDARCHRRRLERKADRNDIPLLVDVSGDQLERPERHTI